MSPVWTLRRPHFEPDVAAETFDRRGENHDSRTAPKRRKTQLTKEARLENGPGIGKCSLLCQSASCSATDERRQSRPKPLGNSTA